MSYVNNVCKSTTLVLTVVGSLYHCNACLFRGCRIHRDKMLRTCQTRGDGFNNWGVSFLIALVTVSGRPSSSDLFLKMRVYAAWDTFMSKVFFLNLAN